MLGNSNVTFLLHRWLFGEGGGKRRDTDSSFPKEATVVRAEQPLCALFGVCIQGSPPPLQLNDMQLQSIDGENSWKRESHLIHYSRERVDSHVFLLKVEGGKSLRVALELVSVLGIRSISLVSHPACLSTETGRCCDENCLPCKKNVGTD